MKHGKEILIWTLRSSAAVTLGAAAWQGVGAVEARNDAISMDVQAEELIESQPDEALRLQEDAADMREDSDDAAIQIAGLSMAALAMVVGSQKYAAAYRREQQAREQTQPE